MSERKNLAIYNCQTCMFITRNKKDYERHIRSNKHTRHHHSVACEPLEHAAANDDDAIHKRPVRPTSCR